MEGERADEVNGRGDADHGATRWLQREEAHSRHVLSTAKLVTTFSAATAATFVATALQSGSPNVPDNAAAVLMLVSLALTVWVVVLPRKSDVKVEHLRGKTPREVQTKLLSAAEADAARARLVYWVMVAQIAFAAAASLIAVIGLLTALDTAAQGCGA